MKLVIRILLFLHIFIGLGAMAGGLAAILDPMKPLGIGVEALHGYFDSFFIPGLFLFFVLGVGNLLCAYLFRFKPLEQGYTSGFIGAVLVFWIIIQCIILRTVAALHIIFAVLGVIQGGLALAILTIKRKFPMNIILNILGK